ncbi:MAG: COX15/CtaA family protein [Chitinophagaceae bacterium]|jgi:cytochrome c oxidase assembly protein subunit 15|nr:COX15/CtaA family protein [Chitinophagaceae bacterium]
MYVAASRSNSLSQEKRNDKQVATWLLTGVVMVIIQIALGGITRLTGSGLSITEWEVVTGTLPPLSESAWLFEFEKYKSTPQFKLLNSDFSLSDFKFIFFWEWFHRLWARILGLVFAVGFVYFLVTKKFRKPMVMPLVILFLLGGLQGFVGWIMVASGLVGDAVYVKPTRLALHFIFALGLLSYTFWFYLKLVTEPDRQTISKRIGNMLPVFIFILVVQLIYGALMAGHKAASAAPTWPDINGSVFSPAGLYKSDHGLLNLVDNRIMVHYVHRGLAYLLLFGGIWLTVLLVKKTKKGTSLYRTRFLPAAILALQVLLGIFSVLTSTGIVPNQWGLFEWMAQLHQLTGMVLLLAFVYLLYLTKGGKKPPLTAV